MLGVRLTVCVWAQCKFEDAEPLIERALKGRELARDRLTLPTQRPCLVSPNAAGALRSSLTWLAPSCPPHRCQVLGQQHPDTLESACKLASILTDQGKYDEAESLYQRALAGREATLGVGHPDTVDALNSLANLLRATGRRKEAAQLQGVAAWSDWWMSWGLSCCSIQPGPKKRRVKV